MIFTAPDGIQELVPEGARLSVKTQEMLDIFYEYKETKIDLFSFFKEKVSKITKGGMHISEFG